MNQKKLKTLDYYNQHSEEFISNTLNVDMTSLYQKFLPLLPLNGKILDIGCGSGRDALAFKKKGYYVEAFDGSNLLVNSAKAYTGLDVQLADFDSFTTKTQFDGLWACASLLHITNTDLLVIIPKFMNYLKPKGFFYLSFKLGEGEVIRENRYFNLQTNDSIKTLINSINIQIKDLWITTDLRPNREESWINLILIKEL